MRASTIVMAVGWLAASGTGGFAQQPDPASVPDEGSELAAMEAVETAAFAAKDWPGPDSSAYSPLEGLGHTDRARGLRGDMLVYELGSGGLLGGHGRPGAAAVDLGRIRLNGFDIPMVINPAVEQYMSLLSGSGQKMFSRWLARTTRYYPIMRPVLRKHGLPEDLVTVALIESGLKYSARSQAQAVGPWQFVERTGRAYGLKSDFWLDERRDFIKATDAAARHLKDLYDRFGDWYLAWAAYNTGETRVARALARTGAHDYWGIRESSMLAEETKRYVPKIIAAALITKNPERYGFTGIAWQPPLAWDEVEVPGPVNLKAAARATGVDLAAMQELNPELRYWCTPPYMTHYRLRIPQGSLERFRKRYKPKARDQQVTYSRHLLKAGETLSHLAVKYGTSVSALLAANRIADARRIRAGTRLIVPVRPCGGGPRAAAARANGHRPPKAAAKPVGRTVRVEAGDTLWRIAAEHGTTVEALQKRNRLKKGAVLSIGQVIALPPKKKRKGK